MSVDDHKKGGCFAVQRQDIKPDLSSSCACSEKEVCDPQAGSCSIEECDFMQDPLDGIIVGNMNSVGSRVKVICNKGYLHNVDFVQCNSNGTWSHVPQCMIIGARVNCLEGCDDSFYIFVSTKSTSAAAERTCELTGGHLAKVTNEGENTFLQKEAEIMEFDDLWIGLHHVGLFSSGKWTDGSMTDFRDWAFGEPNAVLNEDCARMKKSTGFRWADIACSVTYAFICEYSIH